MKLLTWLRRVFHQPAGVVSDSKVRSGLAILTCLLPNLGLAQPTVTVEPRAQFAWEGRQVSLNVSAQGAPPLAYQWLFNGTNVPNATNRVFSRPNIQVTNSGDYRVIVTDSAGAVTSQVARVIVRAWPQPTGPQFSQLASLDTFMRTTLLDRRVPGASLAVVKDGRLVFARGYGYADAENGEPFQPDSLCRVASMSKTVTAAAVMKLIEEGKFELNTRIFGLLNLEPPNYSGAVFDPRWTNITIRHLLTHTGGWDEDNGLNPLGGRGFTPNSWPDHIRRDLGLETLPTPQDLVRWMMGRPLQFTPGTTRSYADFGFDVAGVVIARVTGRPYHRVVQELFAGAGITRLRVGTNTRAERAPGEVVYHLHPNLLPGSWALPSFEPRPFDADLPYAWPVSLYVAAGGWIMSAIDYARFAAAIDGQSSYPDILGTNSVAAMINQQLGWLNGSSLGSGLWFALGADTGNHSVVMRRSNGVLFVYMQNANWPDSNGVFETLPGIMDGIRQWPAHDLFEATLSYDAWRARRFSTDELSQPAESAEEADPDGDGLANLLEYAQGTDPRTPSPSTPLAIFASAESSDPRLAIRFRRLLLAHEVEYALEISHDLKAWAPVDGAVGEESSLNPDGTLTATVRLTPTEAPAGRFFRLRVTRRSVP